MDDVSLKERNQIIKYLSMELNGRKRTLNYWYYVESSEKNTKACDFVCEKIENLWSFFSEYVRCEKYMSLIN